MDLFKKIVHEHGDRLTAELKSSFVLAPKKACDCGKPVVFFFPNTTFKCTRCGRKWKLIVEARPIP